MLKDKQNGGENEMLKKDLLVSTKKTNGCFCHWTYLCIRDIMDF